MKEEDDESGFSFEKEIAGDNRNRRKLGEMIYIHTRK